MKKGIAVVLLCLVAVPALLWGCSQAQAEMARSEDFIGGDKVFTNQSDNYFEPATYEDFKGKRFSILTGSLFDGVADRIFNASEKLYFNNTIEEIEAVKLGKADAALMDDVIATLSLQEGQYDGLQVLPVPLTELDFEYGVFSVRQDIIEQYNEFLAQIKADGTLKEMQERWLKSYAFEAVMPEILLTGENGTLTAAIMATYPPFTFAGENGEFSGFDIEQLRRFAAWLGKDIEFVDMDFGAMMSYVASGKADIGGSVYITNERKESFLFSDPDYVSKTVLVVRKHKQETPAPGQQGIITLKIPAGSDAASVDAARDKTGAGFIEWIKSAIHRNLITENRWKMILDGLGVTMTISLLAQVLGTMLGGVLCFVLMHKSRFISGLGRFYCNLIRGLPLVVLLMISYYIIFGKTDVPSMLIAVCAFALVEGAGVASNLKGAIDTVDTVEIEAARSLGFTAFGAFQKVTLPQAVKRALPAYCAGFIELVKATAIVGYIAIQDMTRAGDIIRSRTYDAFFPLLFVAAIYLIVTSICVYLFKKLVRMINKEMR